VSFTLLVIGWVAATTPFGAPDEVWHYLRALNIANGHILGSKVPYEPSWWITAAQRAFVDHDTRAVSVPASLAPHGVLCMNGQPDLHGSCLIATPNGNFPPLGYLLPAAAQKLSHSASSGLSLMRGASAIQSIAFIILAVALLWEESGWSLLGLLVAATPMVLFVSSIMNSSGIQVAASLAFAAAVLRITRAPERASGRLWAAFAVAGAATMLAGPIGLVFALGDLALFFVLLGRRGAARALRARRDAAIAGFVLVGAGMLALIYSRVAGFSGTVGVAPFWHNLSLGLQQLHEVLHQAVGNFGSLTVQLPLPVCWIWWSLVLILLGGALWVSDRRDRLILVAVTLCALAFPVLFWAWVDRLSGFGLQGREVLPVLTLVPLVSGELIFRRSSAFSRHPASRGVLGTAIALIAVVQGYAWWFSARATAGAPDTIRFYAHSTWSPPGGWFPWILTAALGSAAMLAFAATEALIRTSAPHEHGHAAGLGLTEG
jgi:hypothetical protein